jgi:C4-type Zn-finger protein
MNDKIDQLRAEANRHIENLARVMDEAREAGIRITLLIGDEEAHSARSIHVSVIEESVAAG